MSQTPSPRIRSTIDSVDPSRLVQITDDGTRTLVNRATGDSYHSASGALSETIHVYLRNSGIENRLERGLPTRVLEIGLGTAMGMLATVDLAASTGTSLQYVAIENDWISYEVIRSLHPESWVRDAEIVESFLTFRASLPFVVTPSNYRWSLRSNIEVSIQVGNALDIHLIDAIEERFDAIYFDPFAPESNPTLWQREFLERMFSLLKPGGRLTTYCVKREVRDLLYHIGFCVEKVRGPAKGKREVLIASKAT